MDRFLNCLLQGNNNPCEGKAIFDSSDHIRYKNGVDVSGHNYGCNRRITVEKNIEGNEGYTVAIYNLDSVHPLWGNNVQMTPKQMKVVNIVGNQVELRGYGYDMKAVLMGVPMDAASFSDYGLILTFEENRIIGAQLNMYDRNLSIVYV